MTDELCCRCDEPTGRAGRADDSLYSENDLGPFCGECWGDADWWRLISEKAVDPAEIARLRSVIEHDRSTVADGISSVIEAIRQREWLRLGRGSYEFDDDRWRDEFGEAIDAIVTALAPLKRVAADQSDCPKDTAEIAAARAACRLCGRPAAAVCGEPDCPRPRTEVADGPTARG